MSKGLVDLQPRLDHLDGIRGLAALTVFAAHCMAMLPVGDLGLIAVQLSEKIKWLAVPAVDVFFVLSGFCLMYSLERTGVNMLTTSQFLVKRVFRIYPAYLGAVLIAYAVRQSFYEPASLQGMSSWLRSFWSENLAVRDVIGHVVLILPFDYSKLNPVVWTLSVEMRMSLLFPAIAWVLVLGPRATGELILVMACIGIVAFQVQYLAYLPLFALGAVAAKRRKMLVGWIPRSLWTSLLILAVSSVLLIGARTVHPGIMRQASIIRLVIGVFSTYFILLSIAQMPLNTLLRTPVASFLGRISYSFYLLHLPVLLAVGMLLARHVPIVVIWPIGLVCSILLAWISYEHVEKPAQQLGRWISVRLDSGTSPREATC